MTPPRRRWTDMTTEDFGAGDVATWIAVLPLAAVEQHGPHLPLGVDLMIGDGYLARVEALIPEGLPVTILPAQAVGVSQEHVAFPGTLSLPAEAAIAAWTAIGASVARAGVRKLVIVNAHGGNSAVIDIVAQNLRALGMLAVVTSWSRLGYPQGLFSAGEIRHGVHAGAVETSLMQAFRGDLVRDGKIADFPAASVAMERDNAVLRAGRPAGFAWAVQDLNPDGALGDAGAGSAKAGERAADHGARAFVALLGDVHRFPLEALAKGPLER